jgi:UDP-N-acetylglucosamine diphosphorylase/glucosamine-1-phosphate N-acetyltransferase
MNQYGFFEDAYSSHFSTLSPARALYELRIGCGTLLEKCTWYYRKKPQVLLAREAIQKYLNQDAKSFKASGMILLINGRLVFNEKILKKLSLKGNEEEIFFDSQKTVAAVRLKASKINPEHTFDINQFAQSISKKTVLSDVEMLLHPFDLIAQHLKHFNEDLNFYIKAHQLKSKGKGLFTHSKLPKNVITDTSEGPIVIEKNVSFEPFVYLKGPLFIGSDTQIKAFSRILGSSLGPVTRVCGEVSASIIEGYSNKQHEGFIGSSYIGRWVNLGASTTISNLKNNYHPISIFVHGQKINSGMQFLGAMIGDHVKTGINTSIKCGSVYGFGSMIAPAKREPKFVPPFSFIDDESHAVYDFNKFIDAVQLTYARRKLKLTAAEKDLFFHIYQKVNGE